MYVTRKVAPSFAQFNTYLCLCSGSCALRFFFLLCNVGIKGFWWSYPNIYDLVERELKIENPFTDWTRSSFFSPDGLQVVGSSSRFAWQCRCLNNPCSLFSAGGVTQRGSTNHTGTCGTFLAGSLLNEPSGVFSVWYVGELCSCARNIPCWIGQTIRRFSSAGNRAEESAHILPGCCIDRGETTCCFVFRSIRVLEIHVETTRYDFGK